MTKFLAVCGLIAMSLPVWAQKVTLKKDEFRIDGDAVAKINEKRSENILNKNFEITNMKDEPLITLKINYKMNPLGFDNPTWYEVHFIPQDKSVTREVPDGLFGIRKILLEEFADLGVITKEGLSDEGVNKYMQAHTLDLAVRSKVFVDSIAALTARSSYVKARESGRIRVGDGTIKEKDVQIGTWEKYGSSTSGHYVIRNDEGGIVGLVRRSKGFSAAEVEVYMFINGERSSFNTQTGITINDSDRDVIEKFVRFAIERHNM